ncbi:MAG: O-antigen ligase family protein [Actinomycetota bacterium]|nr:O-antigen ligase family protein [Actinomycetota bacterium]
MAKTRPSSRRASAAPRATRTSRGNRTAAPALQWIARYGAAVRRYVLAAGVVGAPVLFLRFTRDPFNVPKLAFLVAVVAIAAALRAAEIAAGASWRDLKRLAVPAAAFIVPLSVVWLASPYRSWAWLGQYGRLQGFVPYLVVVVFGILLADAFVGRGAELARAMLWAGAVVGGYAVLQVVGMDPFTWDLYGAPTEAVATTGNPNFTGGFLGIVLPVGVMVAIADRQRRNGVIRLLVPIVAGWIVARSQGGYAAGMAGISIGLGVLAARRWRIGPAAGLVVAVVIAAVTAGSVLYTMVRPDGRFVIGTAAERARWWRAAAAMGADAPVFGHGPDTFAFKGVSYRSTDDAVLSGYDFPDDPHSVYLAMLANGGVLALGGLVVVLGWTFERWRRAERADLITAGYLGAIAAYFVQALVSIDEISLRVALWAALGGAVVGSGVEPYVKTKKRKPSVRAITPRAWAVPSIGVAALGALAALTWAAVFVTADARAQSARSGGSVEEVIARYEATLDLRDDPYYHALYALRLKTLALDPAAHSSTALLDAAQLNFEAAISESPYVFTIVSYGQLLDRWHEDPDEDQDELALAQFKRAIEIDPLNPMNRVEAADVLIELERFGEAVWTLRPAADYVPADNGVFWATFALALAHVGDEEQARQALEHALAANPSDELALEAQRILEEST